MKAINGPDKKEKAMNLSRAEGGKKEGEDSFFIFVESK